MKQLECLEKTIDNVLQNDMSEVDGATQFVPSIFNKL